MIHTARRNGRTVTTMQATNRKYRAPALEKGLDVLELLARERDPMPLNRISATLGRSVSELFRMIQVLEFRGYVENTDTGQGYVLSNRLFALGMSRAPTKDVVDAAIPVMRRLAEKTWQSCHLAVASGDQIVIVARVEAPGDLGFSVRVGHRRNLASSASGLVLFGWQPPAIQTEWRTKLATAVTSGKWTQFERDAAQAHETGFVVRKSQAVDGIIDIAAPVIQEDRAVASLSIPYVKTRNARPRDEAILAVRAAALEISQSLSGTGAAGTSTGIVSPKGTSAAPAPRRARR
jgi:DNA-binding IclR family transcriptional regulator